MKTELTHTATVTLVVVVAILLLLAWNNTPPQPTGPLGTPVAP